MIPACYLDKKIPEFDIRRLGSHLHHAEGKESVWPVTLGLLPPPDFVQHTLESPVFFEFTDIERQQCHELARSIAGEIRESDERVRGSIWDTGLTRSWPMLTCTLWRKETKAGYTSDQHGSKIDSKSLYILGIAQCRQGESLPSNMHIRQRGLRFHRGTWHQPK